MNQRRIHEAQYPAAVQMEGVQGSPGLGGPQACSYWIIHLWPPYELWYDPFLCRFPLHSLASSLAPTLILHYLVNNTVCLAVVVLPRKVSRSWRLLSTNPPSQNRTSLFSIQNKLRAQCNKVLLLTTFFEGTGWGGGVRKR